MKYLLSKFIKNKGKISKFILKEIIIDFFITIFLGVTVSVGSFLLLELSQYHWDWRTIIEVLENNKKFLPILQVIIIFIIFVWLKSLSGTKWGSSLLIILISFFGSFANFHKIKLRGEPVYPSDLTMLTDASSLFKMLDDVNWLMIASYFIGFILISGFLIFAEYKNRQIKTPSSFTTIRLLIFVTSSVFLIQIYNFNEPDNFFREQFDENTSWIHWNQIQNYRTNGFISGFLYNLPSIAIELPQNYSKESVTDLGNIYSKKADIINLDRNGSLEDINVIFIMNESFSDPYNIEGISASADPISQTRELMESNWSGNVLSQSFGGGTANIEFEALTGVSLEPLAYNMTTPFVQLTDKMDKLPSIVKLFSNTNHKTTAIHPYLNSFYKRVEVYEKLGFDSFIHQDLMKDAIRYQENTYISDQTAYKEAMHYIKESSSKDFVHIVTMHNHTPFVDKYIDNDYIVEGVTDNHSAEGYFKGLDYSDNDFAHFIEKLDSFQEKTIVVFWGDHLPSFYNEDIFTKENQLDRYETPLLIYSNFSDRDPLEKEIGLISPIYFMNYVSKLADAPVSPFEALLLEMEKQLPAFEKGRYYTSDYTCFNSREELPISAQIVLTDYDILLYDLIRENNYIDQSNFFEINENR